MNFVLLLFIADDVVFLSLIVKRRPKLKSRYRERVQKAIKYAQTIENWDDLVNPRTLAFFYIGPEPSVFVLKTLDIEGKKSKSYLRQY